MYKEALNKINKNYSIVKRFEGGMSNLTFLIEDEHKNKFVYRYPGFGNELFVNYKSLKSHLSQVEKLNITNELIYYDEETGIKISEYITGNLIDEEVDLSKVSGVLKTLHNSDVTFSNYDHLKRLSEYEIKANNNNEEYFKLKDTWLNIYEEILKEHIKYPTHGDSQFANILITPENEIKILDFEFSGVNDYIYDIASFGNNNFEMAVKLLEAYEGSLEKDKLKRLYAWRMFQCLQWHNVAKYKDEIGLSKDLNMDFAKISDKYLILAKDFFKDFSNI